jgi:3-oxoadipate enol-lactonase/4-carboxymuconolactone decarboxylase
MPFVIVDPSTHTRIYYRLEGSPGKPVLVLSHSLGCDHGMWDPQMPGLLDHMRVLRYDTRGHGASDAPEGDYNIELLGRDVLALTAALGIREFAFCGLSLGGMTGQWIAAHSPESVTKLVLANTSAKFADPSIMDARRRTVLESGMKPIADAVMGRFFSTEVRERNDPHVASTLAILLATNPVGYAGCCAAVRDLDNRELLAKIKSPTLVIGSDTDLSTPWVGHGDLLTARIRGSVAVKLPTAHLSNIEKPRTFTSELLNFLVPQPKNALDCGISIRRQVLGDAHVDRSIENTTSFNRPFQEMITRYGWGTIWTRPGLDIRTRRMLVLTTTAVMGRWEEFRMHVRTGLEKELEACDLQEVLLQAGFYAGLPCANTGFLIAAEEIARAAAGPEPDIPTKL